MSLHEKTMVKEPIRFDPEGVYAQKAEKQTADEQWC
jgi:hypothetical protein